jgi:hypothetical protein
MKRILFIFLLMFVLPASAYEIAVTSGLTDYQAAPCGNWYQCNADTPHTLRLKALSGSIGVYTGPFAGGWQVGAGIGNAGRFTSDAMIHDVDNCTTGCGPLSHMQGQGSEPFAFAGARKTFGKWFAEGDLYVTRMNYENTNFDWYGGKNYSVGPIVSHIDHLVANAIGVGAAIGYTFAPGWSAVAKILPTGASNSQYDPVAKQMTWYRPVVSSSLGYAPFVGVEYKF